MEQVKTLPNQINREKIGEDIFNGWEYLQSMSDFDQVAISTEISECIDQAYQNGAFILPKSPEDIACAIKEGRLVAILGRDRSMQLRFIAASMYVPLVFDDNDVMVIEAGALITNPNVTTKVGSPKEFVFPINDGGVWRNGQTYGSQVLDALIEKAKGDYLEARIVATSRSKKSEKALNSAGFGQVDWTAELRRLSCDPSCRGVADHTNCKFANMDFTPNPNSGCHLQEYQK
jgi:hypothetical protein